MASATLFDHHQHPVLTLPVGEMARLFAGVDIPSDQSRPVLVMQAEDDELRRVGVRVYAGSRNHGAAGRIYNKQITELREELYQIEQDYRRIETNVVGAIRVGAMCFDASERWEAVKNLKNFL